VDNPLINLRVFIGWPYANSLLLIAIAITGLFTSLFFIPQFLQNVQGLQAMDAGMVLVPSALVLVVLMPLAGQIYDKFGPRYPVAIGMAIIAYGSYLLAGMTPTTPRVDIDIWTCIRNVGTGLAMMPIIASGISSLPLALTSSGTGMNNVVRQVASSVAVAVFGSLDASAGAELMADRSALLGSGAHTLPTVGAAIQQGPSGMLSMYQALRLRVLTEIYANGFYVVAIMCAGGAALALLLRSGPAKKTTEAIHVEL
jgi:predicted MFS family arabinose efflux permease